VTASERALSNAFSLLSRLPGARLHEEDEIAWLASGRPLASLNHVHRIRVRGDLAAIDARLEAAHAAASDGGRLPVTWWIGESSEPADLPARLLSWGLSEAEPEYGMVIDLPGLPPPAGTVEEVGDAALDEWLGVMARSYGWSDARGIDAWTELYRGALGETPPPWRHVLVRDGGAAVACASLFPGGDTGFVTNVGTVPEARGAGHGTTATLAVLAIARRAGYRRASLTASVMGRSVYARIGFHEDALLRRFESAGRDAPP
jgi:ribosomal protein S18 acetylase RimI-like enzyme